MAIPAALPGSLIQLAPSAPADFAALGLFALASAGYLLRGKVWDKPDPFHHLWFEKPQEKDASGNARAKETRNIAQKLEESERQLVIFWGSQSGTAEGFANRLARECQLRFGIPTMAADLSDYDAETIALIPQTKLAIFIVSTFGEGDPSDNTAGLWEWLHKPSEVSLQNLRYMAFGLGNRNYKYYNKVIDVVVEALDKFGANRLMPVGRADDAEGATEEDFLAWKDDLFSIFRKELGFTEREVKHEATLVVVEDTSLEPIDLHQGEPVPNMTNRKTAQSQSVVKALAVNESRELFTDKTRNCLHVELDLSAFPELSYKTGDHLGVWPSNPDAEVDRLLQTLGLTERADIPITIKSLDAAVKVKVPTPTTASALFRYYLEICAPVSRDTVMLLSQFAPSEKVKAFLTTLGKDRVAYAEFLSRTHINLGRLLEIAAATDNTTWSSLPLGIVIESIPQIQPRYYSISSSSVVSPRTPTITAVVSNTGLSSNAETTIPGLATNYLLAHHCANSSTLPVSTISTTASSLSKSATHAYNLSGPNATLAGGKLFAHIRKSKFKLPALSSQSIIMIAAGTGLAPFRGFLAERARMKSMGKPVGRMILFFGCRDPEQDYIYRHELAEWSTVLADELRIVTAFSRVGDGKKTYVQDRVSEEAAEVATLLDEQNANVYICGSAAMAREVGARLSKVMMDKHAWSEEQAKQWAESRKRSRKFQEDVWG